MRLSICHMYGRYINSLATILFPILDNCDILMCILAEQAGNTYNTIGFIDAIFFYVVGPVSSELIAFVVSYNLNQQSQTHSATSAKQGINLFVIMIILQIATVLIIALTATNVLKYEFGFIVSCLMAIAAGIAVSYTTPAKK